MNRQTFSDDTTSGRWSTRLRGSRKVTIVARAEDAHGFEWLLAFKREFLPRDVEAKSTNVLPVLNRQPQARQFVLKNLSGYSIFVIDLHELRRRILGGMVERLRPVVPPGVDPYDFVLQLPFPESDPHQFLREMAMQESVLGRLESLLEWSSNPFAEEMRRGGLEAFASRRNIELADRAELNDLNDRQLASFFARLGAAVGDALSPERQGEALMKLAEDHRYFIGGYFAHQLLSIDLETDKTYDVGPAPVFAQLELANNRIWTYVDREVGLSLERRVRRGTLDERPSHTVLGLQAADIAAALAAWEYESAPDDEEGTKALAVKRLFARVLLNGRWV